MNDLMRSKYKKLFIIGNGFDRWQGFTTSYDDFKDYYRKNIHRIAKSLHIKTTTNADGDLITPVEMVFGNITSPSTLPEEFFWTFESSLALLDDQKLIDYFQKCKKGINDLQKTIDKAQRLIRKAFGDWIAEIDIKQTNPTHNFGNDSYFINFNYSDTLIKRFGVEVANDYHIHGEATEPEDIIFGHSSHPETAFSELMEQKMITSLSGGKSKRLQGLYLVESALYETDKHIQDNIDDLCEFMTLDGVHIEDITDIYVLGHSLADVDYEYFDFLVKATQAGCDFNKLSALWQVRNIGLEDLDEESLSGFIQMNILYATNHQRRVLGKNNIRFPKAEALERDLFGQTDVYTDREGAIHKLNELNGKDAEAVHKRFIFEQAIRTKEVIEELCILKRINGLPDDCLSVLKAADYIDGGHEPRVDDAVWHISYYSEQDKDHIEKVMEQAGCNKYILYHGIDECIADFKLR